MTLQDFKEENMLNMFIDPYLHILDQMFSHNVIGSFDHLNPGVTIREGDFVHIVGLLRW